MSPRDQQIVWWCRSLLGAVRARDASVELDRSINLLTAALDRSGFDWTSTAGLRSFDDLMSLVEAP